MRGVFRRALQAAVISAAAVAVAGCGSSAETASTPVAAATTQSTAAATTPAPAKPAQAHKAKHTSAAGATTTSSKSTRGQARTPQPLKRPPSPYQQDTKAVAGFGQRISAICADSNLPPPPRTTADLSRPQASQAAMSFARLASQLPEVRPPVAAQNWFGQLLGSVGRLANIYGHAELGRPTQKQLRASIAAIRTEQKQLNAAARAVGANSCVIS